MMSFQRSTAAGSPEAGGWMPVFLSAIQQWQDLLLLFPWQPEHSLVSTATRPPSAPSACSLDGFTALYSLEACQRWCRAGNGWMACRPWLSRLQQSPMPLWISGHNGGIRRREIRQHLLIFKGGKGGLYRH